MQGFWLLFIETNYLEERERKKGEEGKRFRLYLARLTFEGIKTSQPMYPQAKSVWYWDDHRRKAIFQKWFKLNSNPGSSQLVRWILLHVSYHILHFPIFDDRFPIHFDVPFTCVLSHILVFSLHVGLMFKL